MREAFIVLCAQNIFTGECRLAGLVIEIQPFVKKILWEHFPN